MRCFSAQSINTLIPIVVIILSFFFLNVQLSPKKISICLLCTIGVLFILINDYKNELGGDYSPATLCEKIAEKGEQVKTINDKTFIYKISSSGKTRYVAIIFVQKEVINSLGIIETITTEAKGLQLENNDVSTDLSEEINATEDELITKQKIMYNSMFANGSSCFGDLNLQLEDENERRFLYQNYEAVTNSMKTYYEPEEKKDFYRIRVGDRILAVRLDAYSIINAYNYYRRLSLNNDAKEALKNLKKELNDMYDTTLPSWMLETE